MMRCRCEQKENPPQAVMARGGSRWLEVAEDVNAAVGVVVDAVVKG